MNPLLWAFLLLAVAFGLAVIDLFLPTAGLFSFLATLSAVAAVVVAFTAGLREGAVVIGILVVAVPLLIAGAVRWWPQTPIGRLILIPRPAHPADVLPEETMVREELVGRVGVARTKLLPSGAVRIGGRTYDALSAGRPIDPGQPIKVVELRGGRLIVRPATPADLATQQETTSDQEMLSQPIEQFGIDALDDPLA